MQHEDGNSSGVGKMDAAVPAAAQAAVADTAMMDTAEMAAHELPSSMQPWLMLLRLRQL